MALEILSFVEKVFPSDANFLLVRMKDPKMIYTYLQDAGIIVRDRSSVPLCEGCLRITVGTSRGERTSADALEKYEQEKEIS